MSGFDKCKHFIIVEITVGLLVEPEYHKNIFKQFGTSPNSAQKSKRK